MPIPSKRVAELRRRLDDANHRYHVLDDPDLPDAEYDAMLRELEAMETAHPQYADPNSPTRRIGDAPSGRFEQVAHAVVVDVADESHLLGQTQRMREPLQCRSLLTRPRDRQ